MHSLNYFACQKNCESKSRQVDCALSHTIKLHVWGKEFSRSKKCDPQEHEVEKHGGISGKWQTLQSERNVKCWRTRLKSSFYRGLEPAQEDWGGGDLSGREGGSWRASAFAEQHSKPSTTFFLSWGVQ